MPMFRGIHDKIALYKLNRRENKLDAEGKSVHKEAKEKKDQGIFHEWIRTVFDYEYEHIEWERRRIASDRLIDDADELDLPRPLSSDTDKWIKEKPDWATGSVLTQEIMVELRTTIRNEKRARRETVEWWVKIIGGLIAIVTGLVGALIGLVSVWKHR